MAESKVTSLQRASSARAPKPDSKRVVWTAGLPREELAKPGGILLAMLTARANQLGHPLSMMAEKLNITYGYVSQLRSGLRKPENVSDEFVTACALYLEVPRMTVLLASGRVRPLDVYEDPSDVMTAVPHALKFIQSDPHFGPIMPLEAMDASLPLQFFIVQLYEAATKRKLIPGDFDAESTARLIEGYQTQRDELRKELEADRERKASVTLTAEIIEE